MPVRRKEEGTVKMDEKSKLEMLEKHAKENGYTLSDSASKLVTSMFKKEKKLGGLYCPCRVVFKDDSEERKKELECPCIYSKEEIENEGQCLCGMFIKIKRTKLPENSV